MVLERTSVGLDVHARSIVAGVLEVATGELWSQRLPVATEAVLGWVGRCPARSRWPMRLARPGSAWPESCSSSGCGVWWWPRPSWNDRPGIGSRPTGATLSRLARLLHIGELPGVRVPTLAEEAARDLVQAREDARADLMRARHRLSKLLLRQRLVFEGAAWTQAHARWLASAGRDLDQPGLRVAFDEAHGAVPSRHAATAWMRPSPSWPRPRPGRR